MLTVAKVRFNLCFHLLSALLPNIGNGREPLCKTEVVKIKD